MKLNPKPQYIVLIIGLILDLLVIASFLPLNIISNYQGPKPIFYGIYLDNRFYTAKECYDASLCVFDTSLEFDPDKKYNGMGNLAGEMTTIFIPKYSGGSIPDWVPSWMTNDLYYISNPINVYTWKVTSNGTTKVFRMEEWLLKYYLTISYEWDTNEESGLFTFMPRDVRYRNAEVWLKITLNNMWYFDGADQVFFGIGKITLSNIVVKSKTKDKETDPINIVRVNPSSIGSSLPLYLKPRDPEYEYRASDPLVYKGLELNPNVFPRHVYTRIILEDFGSRVIREGLFNYNSYGDVVTYEFNVHVFVVGQWIVKDIENIPDEYGRQSKVTSTQPIFEIPDLGIGLWGKLIVTMILTLALLIIIALFMPGLLVFISQMFRRLSK